jgi:ferredoxin--NADP+ reductase
MDRIQKAELIAPGIKRFVIEARRIAKKHQAGQFLILRLEEHRERIPLTIESANPKEGTVSIVRTLRGNSACSKQFTNCVRVECFRNTRKVRTT